MNVRVRRSAALLALLAAPLGACSLILDPEECTSDDECAPGVCKEGICIGDIPLTTPDAGRVDGDVTSDAGPVDDMGQGGGDAEVDGALPPDGSPGDADVPADMGRPDAHVPQGPRCAITSPLAENRLTNIVSEGVTVTVTDADTPNDALSVRLNGMPLTLEADGTATYIANLAEGDNPFVLEVEDDQGHRCSDRITIVADRTGPTVTRENPPVDDLLTNEEVATVRACVDDAHGIGMIRARVRDLQVDEDRIREDGRCLMPCAGECIEFDVALAAGANPILLQAFDTLGNASAEDAFVLRFDGTAPEITIDTPADDTAVALRSIPLSGAVTEPGGNPMDVLVRATVTGPRPGDRRVEDAHPDAEGRYAFAALAVFPGANSIQVCAVDVATNQDCETIRVFVETEPPCANIETPQNGAILAAGQIEVCGRACPTTTSVRLEVAGNPTVAELQPGGAWCGTVNLPNSAEYTIRAIATSRAGQTASSQISVVVDSTDPVVVVDSPVNGACVGGQSVTVSGRATDFESRVDTVSVDPGGIVAALRNGNFSAEVPVGEGANRRLTVTARNVANRTGSAAVTITVDRTPPTIELDFAEGAFVAADEAGRVSLGGRLIDSGCGVAGNALVVDNQPVLVGDGGAFTVRSAIGAGPHDLNFLARDAVGNVANLRRRVVVDAAAPTVEVVAPGAGAATIAPEIEVRARVVDADSGVAEVRIGGVVARLEAQPDGSTLAIARVPLEEGDNQISVQATDRVGLVGRVFANVLRDLDEPAVVILSPEAGEAVESTLFVTGTADDGAGGSGIASVNVNGVAAHIAPDGRTWTATGVPLVAGQNRVTVFALDRAGNESIATEVEVRVLDFAATDAERLGLETATHIAWIGSADLDADGRRDLVALSGDEAGVSAVYLQQADGTFIGRPAEVSGLPEDVSVRAAGLGDFNNDGHADLAIGTDDHVELRLGRGNGNFELSGAPGAPEGLIVQDLVVGDVDRNGHLDLLVLAGIDSTLLYGDGAGGFASDPAEERGLEVARTATGALLLDLSADRLQDAVLVSDTTATAYTSDREGNFAAVAEGSGFASAGAARVLPIDADRDGDLDVFAAGANPRFYLADPVARTWTVEARGLAPAEAAPFAAIADFDADALDDVMLGGAAGLEYWRGGEAGFTRRENAASGLPVLVPTAQPHVSDVDGDGDFDLLVPTEDGLQLVRSNRSVTAQGFRIVRLDIRRARRGQAGPNDSVGVWIAANLDANAGADRALVASIFGPTIVTMGVAQAADFVVHYIDKGLAGGDRRNLDGVQPGAIEEVFGPE